MIKSFNRIKYKFDTWLWDLFVRRIPQRFYKVQVGKYYMLQDGTAVHIVGRVSDSRGYESVFDEHKHHRYDRSTHSSDMGRCTGSAHDYSNPRNLKQPLETVDYNTYNALRRKTPEEIKLDFELESA